MKVKIVFSIVQKRLSANWQSGFEMLFYTRVIHNKENIMADKAELFVNGTWHKIDAGGILSDCGLKVEFETEQTGKWTLKKAVVINTGTAPVKLGALHLLVKRNIADAGVEDTLFVDSGGGWFSGVRKATAASMMPFMEYEYNNDMFTAVEDLVYCNQIQNGDVSKGCHYSICGVAAYRIAAVDRGFVCGFVQPLARFISMPIIVNDPVTGLLKALILSCNFAGYELAPGQMVYSEEAIYGDFDDAQKGLDEWAEFCAQRRNIKLRHSEPPVGWLSWYGYRLLIDHEEIVKIADFINKEYPGFGFKYMQIDLGYNKDNLPGEWFETNSHFKDGLKAFADAMRERGFVPGIWCSLYLAAEVSTFAKEHPDALLKKYWKDPSKWFWEPKCPVYYLDPTHPETQAFVSKVIRYFKSFGIKYYKIDFMNRVARVDSDAKPYDPSIGRGAGVFRKALSNVLDELEPDDFLYTCSTMTFMAIGLCSTSMTACDIGNPGFRKKLLEGDRSALDFFARQMTTTMSRYFLHGKLLLLNPDSINIEPPADFEEAWVRVLFVGISGGQVFLGDRFQESSPEIMHMVREVLPPSGLCFKPVDFMSYTCPEMYPEIYHLSTSQRELFAVFNFNCRDEIAVDLAKAGLDPETEYLLWEFRERRFLGIVKGSFVAKMPPAAARLYALTPFVSGKTVIVSTSFHILQGEMELKLDASGIAGTFTRPAGDTGEIFLYDNGKISSKKVTGTGKEEPFSFCV